MSSVIQRPEHRAPVLIAVLVNLILFLFLPDKVQPLPFWVIPSIGAVLLVPLLILNPRRLSRETSWSKWTSILLASLLVLANQATLVLTIDRLLDGQAKGADVLLTALQVWVSSIISFGLVYWEVDRGGPVARRYDHIWNTARADFRFPQNGLPEERDWRPGYIDYAYVAMTNMMAFSPTDAMPMTTRAKLLMAYQAMTGFILLALVISRAVNILA
jgi:uncharacterized membrane protein